MLHMLDKPVNKYINKKIDIKYTLSYIYYKFQFSNKNASK